MLSSRKPPDDAAAARVFGGEAVRSLVRWCGVLLVASALGALPAQPPENQPPENQPPQNQEPEQQDPEQQDPERRTGAEPELLGPLQPGTEPGAQDPFEGRVVRDIVVEPAELAETILPFIDTKADEPLRRAELADDLSSLWSNLKIKGEVYGELLGDEVRVIFQVQEYRAYDRFEFRGLDFFEESEIRSVLGLTVRQRVNRLAANQYAATLRDRYRRRGFAFVDVRIEEDPERSKLTFWVDEGPRVSIDRIHFIGNEAFPFEAPVGFYENLASGSEMESETGSWRVTSGSAYSAEVVDEDLDRLRLFYRKKGFRDARVELAGVVFSADYSGVELTFRVDEGPRYKVASIDLVQVPPPGRDEPTYPSEEVLDEIQMEVGDHYDFQRVQLDKNRIADFYGRRGHPLEGQYGRGIENAFRIGDPRERFDPENAEIHLTYVVEEGTPKRLRGVRIRGNADTESRVIRREIRVMPGDTLDMLEVERSLGRLDALRYFRNPEDFSGVRFELMPVEDEPDEVDLGIDVTEGNTGSFLWGAGVSTAAGVQARFVLSKRNFDVTRPPSSWNPIDWFGEIANNEALHGAGQELELVLAPGTEISLFSVSFYEPDVFRTHRDTIGMRLQGYRRLQFLDAFNLDALGANIGLQRQFTDEFAVGMTLRQETVEVFDPDINAPTIVFEDEGSSELRGVRLNVDFADVDYPAAPTSGHRARLYSELLGGPFGADESIVKSGVNHTLYVPVHRDSLDRAHVLRWRNSFDHAVNYGSSDDTVFVTERYYMGGSTLRGFRQRRAGPSQFDQPVGGEARVLSSLEYQFPLFSTQRSGQIRQTEVLRGVLFSDFGMLGLDLGDLGEPRLTAGFGFRIQVPVLELPIQLDFGWPILDQNSDQQQQFYFSLSRF